MQNFCFAPIFLSTQNLLLSNFVHKIVEILVSEHFSFAELIRPPDRCD